MTDFNYNTVRQLVYSASGVGKTEYCVSAVDDDRTWPTLFCDFEGGHRTIGSRIHEVNLEDWEAPIPGKVDYYRIRNFKDLNNIYAVLIELAEEPERAKMRGIPEYKSVSLDSLSEINYLALSLVTSIEVSKLFHTISMAKIQDYGKTNAMMKKLLRAFRDLPQIHVFLTAQEQFKETGDEQTELVMPSLIGKLSAEAMAIVDFVWYMRTTMVGKNLKREFVTGPRGRIYAKSRSEGRNIPLITDACTVTDFLNFAGVK